MNRDKQDGCFEVDWQDGVMTVRVCGEVDHHNAVEIRCGVDKCLIGSKPKELKMDLSAVKFMDSSGLGLMMGRLALLQKWGGELVVTDPSPAVMRIVNLAGLERLIRIETNTQRKAVSS